MKVYLVLNKHHLEVNNQVYSHPPQGRSPQYPFDRRLEGPSTDLDEGARRKIPSLPLPEIKPQLSSPQPSHYTD